MTREEAIKIFQLMKKILSIPNSDAARTIEAIDMAIEALSERTGEWVDKGNWMGIECSRCKCHSRYVTPFCPQCGAKMKGGEDE